MHWLPGMPSVHKCPHSSALGYSEDDADTDVHRRQLRQQPGVAKEEWGRSALVRRRRVRRQLGTRQRDADATHSTPRSFVSG
jgi:hypothetical protein